MPEKISLSLGGPKKPAPSNGVKRSHAALREDDEEGHEEGKAQTVSHFDKTAGGAVDEKKKQDDRPLTIAPQANRDWREASQHKRQRNGLPPEARGNGASEQAIRELEGKKPQYGLNITKREDDAEEPIIDGRDAQAEAEATQQQAPEPNAEVSVKAKTDDERAMDALLGKQTKENLVVPAASEEEAFERDYNNAPEMATIDQYAAMPVDQFGAALLRGMGWKDGEGIGSEKGKKVQKTKVPERRPALLGIGAKEEAAVAQEMGTWGKAAKKGGEVKIYNPVLLKDKNTGEMFTEEELQKKREKDEKAKYEAEFDRKEKERERRRRRDDSEDDDRSRERSRRDKDKGREKDRRDDRDRRRREDSDEEYYRRKEKERRRRDRDREDDYERERSRRHDSDRNRHREKDRRDRDHDRRRYDR
ncbi:hypothetical protein KC315_g12329 [Hortaea werneckii]|nr:hypothetical protein KC315_g12329 [Hortaea werneckii]